VSLLLLVLLLLVLLLRVVPHLTLQVLKHDV
jgi:hypothetical protein